MDCIQFNDVTFAYPPVPGDLDAEGKQIIPASVFSHFSGSIPSAFTSLIGPNASGKTTFMMLAAGRLIPQEGACTLFGQNIALLSQEEKNKAASVIYQNMEFESNEKVFSLLNFVYSNGTFAANAKALRSANSSLLEECIQVFELDKLLDRGLKELSKGELQRVLLAFSLLYGSASVFMDEPMFAMENQQKESALSYLKEFSSKTGTPIFISMHELDLTRRFAEKVMLFYPDRTIDYGSPEEVMTKEDLEKAYGVPLAMLKSAEDMTREELQQTAQAISQLQGK